MSIKRDELANPDGCLNRAADDEPIFVLRANDENAPGIVRMWAIRYRQSKMADNSQWTVERQLKYHEALILAEQMEDWHREHIRTG